MLLALPSVGAAQIRENDQLGTFKLAAAVPLGRVGNLADPGPYFGFEHYWHVRREIGVGAMIAYHGFREKPHDFGARGKGSGTIQVFTMAPVVRYNFLPGYEFVPFIAGGPAMNRIRLRTAFANGNIPEEDESFWRLGLVGSAGFDYFFEPNWTLGLEITGQTLASDHASFTSGIRIGYKFTSFGLGGFGL